jgi:hypothetical protein
MYAVLFGFEKSIRNPIRRFSQKGNPNTSKNIWFFAVFDFFGSICGFYLDWFGFEHPYPCLSLPPSLSLSLSISFFLCKLNFGQLTL